MNINTPYDSGSKPTTQKQLFEEILQNHSAALLRLCAGYERSLSEREDLMQEILLALWQSLPRFRGDASLRTWMYRVAHNVACTHVNRSMRQPNSSKAEIEPEHEDSLVNALEETQKLQTLRDEIALLKPLHRQVILLHLEDIPHAEIADITGLSIVNVSTSLHRIKKQLKGAISS